MPLRVTACDIGLGPRRLLLQRAYVRTSDPVRSLPRVVCVLAQSAKKTRLRVSAVSPTLGARPRASDPRDFYRIVTFCNVTKLATCRSIVRRRHLLDAIASSAATSCEATQGDGLPFVLLASRQFPADPRRAGGAARPR